MNVQIKAKQWAVREAIFQPLKNYLLINLFKKTIFKFYPKINADRRRLEDDFHHNCVHTNLHHLTNNQIYIHIKVEEAKIDQMVLVNDLI